jgi:hypothetical protein
MRPEGEAVNPPILLYYGLIHNLYCSVRLVRIEMINIM